ncbi:MAG: BON domain-containing protein [Gemmatimonadota bacterium]
MSRNEKLSGGEVLGWTIAGVATGLLAGIGLAAWLGRGGPTRVRQAIGKLRTPPVQPPARGVSVSQRATQAALDGSDLHHFKIAVIGVMPGVIELHGWVPTRPIRARAGRVAAAVSGIERVVNCILVQGEDDKNLKPARSLADQSA